jgi:hypothetical protein
MTTKLALGAVLLAVLATAGCDSTMAQDRMTFPIGSLPFAAEVEGGWETSGWFSSTDPNEQWIEFGLMTTLQIHHPLGRAPGSVEIYTTIDTDPDDGSQPADFGAGASAVSGDAGRIVDVNSMWVEIRNDGDAPQRVRVVVR